MTEFSFLCRMEIYSYIEIGYVFHRISPNFQVLCSGQKNDSFPQSQPLVTETSLQKKSFWTFYWHAAVKIDFLGCTDFLRLKWHFEGYLVKVTDTENRFQVWKKMDILLRCIAFFWHLCGFHVFMQRLQWPIRPRPKSVDTENMILGNMNWTFYWDALVKNDLFTIFNFHRVEVTPLYVSYQSCTECCPNMQYMLCSKYANNMIKRHK